MDEMDQGEMKYEDIIQIEEDTVRKEGVFFVAEWVFYSNKEEREKALEYLNLWKFFILKRYGIDSISENDVAITDRPMDLWNPSYKQTLEMKLTIRSKD